MMNMKGDKFKFIGVGVLSLFTVIFFLGSCSKNDDRIGKQSADQTPATSIRGSYSDLPSNSNCGEISGVDKDDHDVSIQFFPNTETIASPENKEPELIQLSENMSYMEMLKMVLQNKAVFFSSGAQENLRISQLAQTVSTAEWITAEATEFALVDLDGDNMKEVILRLTVVDDAYYGFEILRCQDTTVYGYTMWYRAFNDLKEDGSFSFSSGVSDNGFGTIQFDSDIYTITETAYSQSYYDTDRNRTLSFFVDGKPVAESDFTAAQYEQSLKPNAQWHKFTDENIERFLVE